MEQVRRYTFEGLTLDIPLRYDPLSHMYIEEYPDFIAHPIYTPAGYPVMFIGEDACPHAQSLTQDPCSDCGCCRYFHRISPSTWIGVCKCEQRQQALWPVLPQSEE